MGKASGGIAGNVSVLQVYGPALTKMMSGARTLSTLPLGWMQRLTSWCWVAPVVHLTARAYEPNDKGLEQLNLI